MTGRDTAFKEFEEFRSGNQLTCDSVSKNDVDKLLKKFRNDMSVSDVLEEEFPQFVSARLEEAA
jgi:hypothetical protein